MLWVIMTLLIVLAQMCTELRSYPSCLYNNEKVTKYQRHFWTHQRNEIIGQTATPESVKTSKFRVTAKVYLTAAEGAGAVN